MKSQTVTAILAATFLGGGALGLVLLINGYAETHQLPTYAVVAFGVIAVFHFFAMIMIIVGAVWKKKPRAGVMRDGHDRHGGVVRVTLDDGSEDGRLVQ